MAEKCKQLGSSVLAVLHGLRENRNVTEEVAIANRELQAMSELAATLRGTLQEDSAEQLADLVENELLAMDKNIEEAAQMIQVLNKLILFIHLIINMFTKINYKYLYYNTTIICSVVNCLNSILALMMCFVL